MPLNNFSASFISRSAKNNSKRGTGQNSIAHAAYCSRETLEDKRTGEKFNGLKMGKGQEVEWQAIYTPANAPGWMKDRSELWNRLEAKEDLSKRRDSALLSRSWILTFPHELNSQQRVFMAKDFMREVARQGWVIDGAVHGPDKDNSNWHMHAHIPMRHIENDGFGKRRKLGENAEERNAELRHWKDRWAELGSKQLQRAGFKLEAEEFRYGHLKLEEQRQKAYERGDYVLFDRLDREPQIHKGPAAHAMDKEGKSTFLGEKNRAILERNEARETERERDSREIKRSYTASMTASGFGDSLAKRDFWLARVTDNDLAVDAEQKRRTLFADKGEYVVLNNNGRIYHLTRNTTGDTRPEIAKFLEPLRDQRVRSVERTKSELKAQKALDRGVIKEHSPEREIRSSRSPAKDLASRVAGRGPKVMGKALDVVAGAMESLISPIQTPEQKAEAAERAQNERLLREAESREEQRQRTHGRER